MDIIYKKNRCSSVKNQIYIYSPKQFLFKPDSENRHLWENDIYETFTRFIKDIFMKIDIYENRHL